MANGTDPFAGIEAQDPFQEETQIDKPIHVANAFGNWGPKIVKDPNVDGWKGYGIEVPDINFDFLKIERPEDITPEKLTAKESLTNTWNNVLDQLSLTDDRFYQLSEQLFGDLDSITAKDAQANIDKVEADQQEAGGTLALTDIPDAFEQEGLIGGIAHAGAAVLNAGSAFAASAIQAGLTGGAALATDMVQGSVQDYTRQRAEEEGVSYEEAAQSLGSDVIIPIALGTVAYKFEKAGLKGVGKAIKGMAPGAKKAFVQVLNASGKEGGTELAQGVVEAFNQGLGAKNSLDEAAASVGEFWEKDALETFLQGAVGGGIATGGGQAVRRVASTVRSSEAERTIKESSEKIFSIDAILNSPDIDDEQFKVLKRARTALKNDIKKATKEPNKLVKKLSDDNIAKINKRANDNRRLRDELDQATKVLDPEALAIVKEDINNRVQKNIDSINSEIESAGTKNIRWEDGTLKVAPDKKKKLRVFDFDDTLFSTKANVGVTKADGTKQTLTSEEFATFKPEEGDLLDFSDFVNVRGEKALDHLDVLAKTVKARDGQGVKILTARPAAAAENIKEALVRSGRVTAEEAEAIEVEGIASSDPKDKAKWIRNKIEKEGFGDIYFTDDSQGNIDAVSGDLSTIEGIKYRTQKAGEKAVRGDDSVQKFLKKQIDELGKSKGAQSVIIPGLDPGTAQAALKVALKTYEIGKDLAQAVADAYQYLTEAGHDVDYLEIADAFEAALKEPVSKTNVRNEQSEARANKNVQGVKDGDAESWVDILDQFAPEVNRIINASNWSKNKWAYTAEREDLVNDLNENIIQLARTFKGNKNDSAQAWIFSNLKLRIHDILKRYNTQIDNDTETPIKIKSQDLDTRAQRGASKFVVDGLGLDKDFISKQVDLVLRKGINPKEKKWENKIKLAAREEISLQIAEKLGFRPEAGVKKGHWKNEDFLEAVEKNFDKLWDALPYSAFANTALKEYGVPVLKKDGKPLLLNRKKVIAKEDISFDDFALWINDPSVAASTIRNRKFTFAEALAEGVAWDSMVSKLQDENYEHAPSVVDKAIISLEDLSQQLDKFGRETLGTNPAIVLAKAVIDTAIVLVKAGKRIHHAFAEASIRHNLTPEQSKEIYTALQNDYEGDFPLIEKIRESYREVRLKQVGETDNKLYGRTADVLASRDIGNLFVQKTSRAISEDIYKTKAKGETTEVDPTSAAGLAQLQQKAYKGEPKKSQAKSVDYIPNALQLDKLYQTVSPKFWTILAHAEDAKAKDSKGRKGKDRIGRAPAGSAREKKLGGKQDILNWLDDRAQWIYGKPYAEVLKDQGETALPLPHGYNKKGKVAAKTQDNFAENIGALSQLVYEMSFDAARVDINADILRSLNRTWTRDISPAVGEQEGFDGKLHAEHSRPANDVAFAASEVLREAVKIRDKDLRKEQIQKAFSYIADSYFVLHIDKPWNDSFLDTKRGEGKNAVELQNSAVIGFDGAGDHILSRYFIKSLLDDAGIPSLPPDQIKFYKSGKSILDVFGKDNVAKVAKQIAQKYPELKAEGDQAFNKAVFRELNKDIFEDGLVNVIDKLNSGSLFVEIVPGLTIAKHIVIGGLRTVLAAYRAGKKLADAIQAGYDHISAKVDGLSFNDFKAWFDKNVNIVGKPSDAQIVTILDSAPELIQARKSVEAKKGQTADQAQKNLLDKKKKAQEKADKDNQADNSVFNSIVKEAEGKKFGKGKRTKKFSFIPSGAEDFEGLMYVLYGKGNKIKQKIDKYITQPYERGVATAINQKIQLIENFKNLKKQHDIDLNKAAGLKLRGKNITQGQAVRLYNAIKQGEKLDLSDDQKQRVLDYVNAKSNAKIKAFAEALPKIYREANSLTSREENSIPYAYDKDGNVDYTAGSLQGDLLTFANKEVREHALAQFNQNVGDIFSDTNIKRLEALYGKDYASALKNIIHRMKTGRNRSVMQDKYLGRVLDWVNGSQAVIMFWNFRSAGLQLISTLNYIKPSDLKYYGKFKDEGMMKTVKMLWNSPYLIDRRKGIKLDVATEELLDGALSESKWDRFMAKATNIGFMPTKYADSFAIAMGGAIYYRARRAEGMNHDQALQAWIAESEKAQQSSRADRISSQQASNVGRVLLAFANTPMQYARQIKRAIQDLRDGRGSSADNIAKIVYYGALQGVMFNFLQQALWNSNFFDDEEDEDEKRKKEYAINSFIDSLLRGTGLIGNTVAAIKTAAINKDPLKLLGVSPPVSSKVDKLIRSKKVLDKRWDARWPYAFAAANTISASTNLPADWIYKKAEAAMEIADNEWDNLDKVLRLMGYTKKQLGVEDTGPGDPNDPFSGLPPEEDPFAGIGDSDGEDPFANVGDNDSPFNRLARGEAGQAHRDGTIEVDPNLTPIERQKTIDHEMEHVRQMEEDGLDYDDDYVYYKGKKHMRRNGKIRYNGRWHEEGGKKLPWEAEAYKAESPLNRTTGTGETGTGVITGEGGTAAKGAAEGGVDEDRFDKEGNLITDPKLIDKRLRAADAEADTFTANWYNDPETRKRLKAQTGLSDAQIDERIKQATEVETRSKDIGYADAESHDRGTFMGEVIPEGEPGHFKGRIDVDSAVDPAAYGNKGLLEHEHAHQAGWDNQLGYKAQKILGKGKQGYMNNPAEVYGNMQEFRAILGLKPNQRNLTPTKIKAIIKAKGLDDQPDVQQMFYNFDIDKVSEALNTIASANPKKKKKTLRDYYV